MKNNRYTESCLHCCCKHLGQAAVLFDESRNGYPLHKYLAGGNMAEAESEVLLSHPGISAAIRHERLKMETDQVPNFMFLLDLVDQERALTKRAEELSDLFTEGAKEKERLDSEAIPVDELDTHFKEELGEEGVILITEEWNKRIAEDVEETEPTVTVTSDSLGPLDPNEFFNDKPGVPYQPEALDSIKGKKVPTVSVADWAKEKLDVPKHSQETHGMIAEIGSNQKLEEVQEASAALKAEKGMVDFPSQIFGAGDTCLLSHYGNSSPKQMTIDNHKDCIYLDCQLKDSISAREWEEVALPSGAKVEVPAYPMCRHCLCPLAGNLMPSFEDPTICGPCLSAERCARAHDEFVVAETFGASPEDMEKPHALITGQEPIISWDECHIEDLPLLEGGQIMAIKKRHKEFCKNPDCGWGEEVQPPLEQEKCKYCFKALSPSHLSLGFSICTECAGSDKPETAKLKEKTHTLRDGTIKEKKRPVTPAGCRLVMFDSLNQAVKDDHKHCPSDSCEVRRVIDHEELKDKHEHCPSDSCEVKQLINNEQLKGNE